MSEEQEESPRERVLPNKEQLEAIRRTDKAISESKRGTNTPDVFVPKEDYTQLLDYLQQDVNLFMDPETGGVLYRGAKLFVRKQDERKN